MIIKGFKTEVHEFVAEVISENNGKYIIKNPLVLILSEHGVMPIDYILSSKSELELDATKLLIAPFDVVEQVSSAYKKKFSTIIQPEPGILL